MGSGGGSQLEGMVGATSEDASEPSGRRYRSQPPTGHCPGDGADEQDAGEELAYDVARSRHAVGDAVHLQVARADVEAGGALCVAAANQRTAHGPGNPDEAADDQVERKKVDAIFAGLPRARPEATVD